MKKWLPSVDYKAMYVILQSISYLPGWHWVIVAERNWRAKSVRGRVS